MQASFYWSVCSHHFTTWSNTLTKVRAHIFYQVARSVEEEVPLVMPLLAECITLNGRSMLEKERNAIRHELGTCVGRNRDKFVLFEPLVVISLAMLFWLCIGFLACLIML